MPNATNSGANPVLALELDRNGNVSKKIMKLDREPPHSQWCWH
jgi:hypothetical protein